MSKFRSHTLAFDRFPTLRDRTCRYCNHHEIEKWDSEASRFVPSIPRGAVEVPTNDEFAGGDIYETTLKAAETCTCARCQSNRYYAKAPLSSSDSAGEKR